MKNLLLLILALSTFGCNPTTSRSDKVDPMPDPETKNGEVEMIQKGSFGAYSEGVTRVIFGYPTTAVRTSMIDETDEVHSVLKAIGLSAKPVDAWPKCIPKSSIRLLKGGEELGEFGYCGGYIRDGEKAYKIANADALTALVEDNRPDE